MAILSRPSITDRGSALGKISYELTFVPLLIDGKPSELWLSKELLFTPAL